MALLLRVPFRTKTNKSEKIKKKIIDKCRAVSHTLVVPDFRSLTRACYSYQCLSEYLHFVVVFT